MTTSEKKRFDTAKTTREPPLAEVQIFADDRWRGWPVDPAIPMTLVGDEAMIVTNWAGASDYARIHGQYRR